METELTPEQRLVVATVRDFVERELYPHEAEVERLDEVPAELAQSIRARAIAAGLYAAAAAAGLGGGGLDAVSVVLAERELGRASYALQMLMERPSNILQACAGELAEAIRAAAPLAVTAVLEIVRKTAASDVRRWFEILRGGELPAYRAMLASDDAREGPRAFAAGRRPVWRGQ